MPVLTPTKLFLKDLEAFQSNKGVYEKIIKTLAFLEENPLHTGLRIERIVNDATAWSVRVDRRYRISLDPIAYTVAGTPNWDKGLTLLRILDHDDLYKKPR